MSKFNDPNSFRNRLCSHKKINISEAIKNRIVFEKVHNETMSENLRKKRIEKQKDMKIAQENLDNIERLLKTMLGRD